MSFIGTPAATGLAGLGHVYHQHGQPLNDIQNIAVTRTVRAE
jgi:hypothetical protein